MARSGVYSGDGHSTYDALDVSVVRNLHRGVQIQGSLTREQEHRYRFLYAGRQCLLQCHQWPSLVRSEVSRGVSDFNIPRAAVIHGIWEFPAAKSAHDVRRLFLNGWG